MAERISDRECLKTVWDIPCFPREGTVRRAISLHLVDMEEE